MALTHSPKIVTDGLVLLLDAANTKSYPGSGTSWTDLSKNGNNGTNSNMNFVESKGGVLEFFEANSSVSTIANSASLNSPVSELTIEAYVSFDADSTDFIFEKGNVNTQYSLFSHGTDLVFRTYHVGATGYDSLYAYKFMNGSYKIVNGRFHHLVGSYNGTTKKIYIDGIEVSTKDKTGNIVTTSPGAAVGRFGGSSSGYFFDGKVARVSIYNRGLNAKEVLQNYNAIKGRFKHPVRASTDGAAAYTATPASSSVNEGSSLTINVATANVPDGTTLYFYNSKQNADFPVSSRSGSFTINNNAGSFTVTPSSDSSTEGSETFTVSIRTGSTSGTTVATTSTITINDTSTGGKIICTALNDMYGFGSFRNKIWMKYNNYDKARYLPNPEILELGYHKLFGKLTEIMPSSPLLTKVLRRIARVRTDRIRREMTGKPLTLESKIYAAILIPTHYAIGWLVHKGILKEYKRKVKS